MASIIIQSLFISILVSCSAASVPLDFKSHFLWKANFFLVSVLDSPLVFTHAAAPPEMAAKIKEKIKKGQELLENLNSNLEKIKTSLKEKKNVDQDILDEVIEIKDKFRDLKVDPSDLTKDLLEKFKEKTLEALKLIMESYGLDKFLDKHKKKPTDAETEEVKAEESEDSKEETKEIDDKVDNNISKNKRQEEL